MSRRDPSRLVLRALQTHGPMTDPQLAWWMAHFGLSDSTTRRARRRLTDRGKVRWTNRARTNERGQLIHVWEAVK